MNGLSSRPQKHSNTARTGASSTVSPSKLLYLYESRGGACSTISNTQMEREAEPNPAVIGEADDGVQADQSGKNKAFVYHAAGSAVILLVAVILRTQQAGKCWDPLSRLGCGRVHHQGLKAYFVHVRNTTVIMVFQ